ncbi:MAG: dTMP kinase [Ignavibacteriae bacterium]|nr:MAG: dTMP kinase [Ignavibacteriota bacterium]
MFITFEGLDFCGKSTQVELLEKFFLDKKKEVKIIREPGGVKISEEIRKILLDNKNQNMFFKTELLLFAASRAQLVNEIIIPFLDNDVVVISDRFHDSSIAYQGFGRGLDLEFVISLQNYAIGKAVPDLTFFIDLPISEINKRKEKNENIKLDRIEISNQNFYEKVREGYNYLTDKDKRFVKINGLNSIDDIHREIISIINKNLKVA